jgi:hypothetical protein
MYAKAVIPSLRSIGRAHHKRLAIGKADHDGRQACGPVSRFVG